MVTECLDPPAAFHCMWEFGATYIHLSILFLTLESLVVGNKFELSQVLIGNLFQSIHRSEADLRISLCSLFCVCLILGPDSHFTAEGTYDVSSGGLSF